MAKKTTAKQNTNNGESKFKGIRNFFTSERTRFITGLVISIVTIYVGLALISFFFTGGADQSKIENIPLSDLVINRGSVENWTGVRGAFLADLLMNRWFGISSFLILFFLGSVGAKLMNLSRVSLLKRFLFSAAMLIWGSLFFAFIFIRGYEDTFIYLGGQHGYYLSEVMMNNIGIPGTILLLVGLFLIIAIFTSKRTIPFLQNVFSFGWLKNRLKREKSETPEVQEEKEEGEEDECRSDYGDRIYSLGSRSRDRDFYQEKLEQEAEMLSHAEEIKAGLYRVEQSFASDEGGLLSYLKDSLNTLNNLQRVYQPAKELAERMESAYIELKDISQEVSSQGESIEFNPTRLDEVNDRLNMIYSLQQKHRAQTLDELIALTDEYRSKLSDITSYDERIAELTVRKEEQYKQVKQQAELLTKARTKAAREVEKQLAARLIPLGMPNVRFQIEMGLKKEPGLQGEDTVNFLFSANKNGTLQNISSVASGGEIARVMLSIKALIAGAVKLRLSYLMK